ncbi:MAG: HYR domain-containing protein [Saprospiraceae bacterium]
MAIDSLAPEMVCPEAIFSCAGDTVHYELPMVFDNCDLGPSESALISGLPSNTVFPPGIHTVIFQATDLLGNTSSCSFSIHVNTLPTVQVDTIIHDAGNGGTGYIGVSVEVGSGGMVQFTWEKDGAAFPAFTEDLDQLFSGTYRLTASDSNGCAVVLDSLVVENAVGIKEALWGSELLDIWPNPVAQGLFCIGGTFGKPESMVLINIEGQVVQAFPVASWPGPFYLPDLPVGLYVLCLRTSEGRVHRMRLVIGQ